MSKFFKNIVPRRVRQEIVPAPPHELEKLQQNYIDLCCGDTQFPREHAAEDFMLLVGYPRITHLAINQELRELYIGTTEVQLPCKENWHRIGRFIITISRRDNIFWFENIDSPYIEIQTPTIFGNEDSNRVPHEAKFAHPHVHPNGRMCMPSGEVVLIDAIQRGDLYSAGMMAVDALYLTKTGYPVRSTSKWPKIEEF